MKKNILYIILIFLVLAIVSRKSGCETEGVLTIPKKPDQVVDPVIIVPELENNILYDNYEESKRLAKIHDMNIIVVFSADWCVYCKKLKNDLKNISNLDKYIVCIIDIEKDKSLARKWKVKNLPTSVAINSSQEVISQIVGYKRNNYESWINSM